MSLNGGACISTLTETLSKSVGPEVDLQVASNATCSAPNSGSLVAVVSGGTVPFSYSWTGGAVSSTSVATGLASGVYGVVVRDFNGCEGSDTATISSGRTPTVSVIASTNPTCESGGSILVSATDGSGTGYTFQWTPLGSGTFSQNLPSGEYTITVTDSAGCSGSITTELLPDPGAVTLTLVQSEDASACGAQDGSITVAAPGAVSFSWCCGIASTSATASNLGPGTYSVVATTADGCTGSLSIELGVTQPFVEQLVVIGDATFTVVQVTDATKVVLRFDVAGTLMSPIPLGTPLISAVGQQQLTKTAAEFALPLLSSTVEVSVDSTEPFSSILVSLTPTQPTCSVLGSIVAVATGGSGSYSYLWSTAVSSSSIANLGPGTYSVVVTDQVSGCNVVASAVLHLPSNPVAVISSIVQPDCNNVGSITASASGGALPYAYSWADSPSTDIVRTNLGPAVYTVTVTDQNGCVSSASGQIFAPPTPPTVVVSTVSLPSCSDPNGGSVTALVSGGSGGYAYSWSTTPPQTTQTATGLGPGSYQVTVVDEATSCQVTSVPQTLAPSQAVPMIKVLQVSNPTCVQLGFIAIQVSGGSGSYTFQWKKGAADISGGENLIGNLTAGSYSVSVWDAITGCGPAVQQFTLTQTAPPTIEVTSVMQPSCTTGGSISVAATGGSGEFSFSWSPTGLGTTSSNLPGNTVYTITVTVALLFLFVFFSFLPFSQPHSSVDQSSRIF